MMAPFNDHKITRHSILIPGYNAYLQKKTSKFSMHEKFINNSYFIWSYMPDT